MLIYYLTNLSLCLAPTCAALVQAIGFYRRPSTSSDTIPFVEQNMAESKTMSVDSCTADNLKRRSSSPFIEKPQGIARRGALRPFDSNSLLIISWKMPLIV